MWGILIWILELGVAALSILFIVLAFKNRSMRNKPLAILKYVFLTVSALTLAIGRIVADPPDGRDKAMCLALLFLMVTAAVAYLSDMKKDF